MSVQAMAWVLDQAPGLPPHCLGTLIAVANATDSHGRNAWPAQETIARQARKSVRAVRKDLAELEELGLLTRGDQRIVSHIRPDRRPVVWDVPIARPEPQFLSSAAGTTRPVVEGRATGTTVPTTRHEPKDSPTPNGFAARGHDGQHKNCRACGTNPRARHADAHHPRPLAEVVSIEVCGHGGIVGRCPSCRREQ